MPTGREIGPCAVFLVTSYGASVGAKIGSSLVLGRVRILRAGPSAGYRSISPRGRFTVSAEPIPCPRDVDQPGDHDAAVLHDAIGTAN
jgi:hypothetical protein